MPEKDIFGELIKDPLYRQTAEATDNLIGSDFTERIKRHELDKSEDSANINEAETVKSLLPNETPVNSPYGPTIGVAPKEELSSPLTLSQESEEYANQVAGLISNAGLFADKSKYWSKPFGFDTGRSDMDFDRFYAYGDKFRDLGYLPGRDNDAVYNANTSWWDDWVRMTSRWPSLAGTSIKSLYGNPFSTDADTEGAEDFEKDMYIMQSTKKGFGAKFTNLAANSAFTMGFMGAMLAENIAMHAGGLLLDSTGVGAAAGGALHSTAIARTANNLRRYFGLANKFKNVGQMSKIIGNTSHAMADVGRSVQNTRDFLAATKSFGGDMGKFALKSVLPTNTARFAKNILTGKNGYDKISDLAAFRKGVGSLFLDIRELNYAVAESRIEGGSVTNNLLDKLSKEYYAKEGKVPEGEDAEYISEIAHKAGNRASFINLPTIYLTNKLVFGKSFRGFTPATALRQTMSESLGKTILIDESKRAAGKKVAEAVGGLKKFIRPAYWKQAPSVIAGNFLRYTQVNWSEAAQESAQSVIAEAVEKYYDQVYHDPAMAGSRQAYGAFKEGVAKQFTPEGADTFLSGFFMGALVGPVQTLVYKHIGGKISQISDPEDWQRIKTEQQKRTDLVVDAINDMDPKAYFSILERNLVTQIQLDKLMEEAQNSNEFRNAKSDSLLTHFHAMLETGNFNYFIDRLKDLKNLNPSELKELSNNAPLGDKYNKSATMYDRIDKVVERAEQVKRRYEQVNKLFPDLPDIYKYSKAKNPTEYAELFNKMQGYREAKKMLVYASYGMDDSMRRMASIEDDMASITKPVSKVPSNEFTILFNNTQIKTEEDVLAGELKVLTDAPTPELKKKYEEVKKKKEELSFLSADMNEFKAKYEQWKRKEAKKKDVDKAHEAFKKSYYNYVKGRADAYGDIFINENVTASFEGLVDHIKLGDDANRFAFYVNALHDPENFISFANRLGDVSTSVFKARKASMLVAFEKLKDREDETSLINALYNIGVFVDPDSINKLKKGELDNIAFISVAEDRGLVDKDSPLYKDKIIPILKKYKIYKEVVRNQKEEDIPEETVSDEEYEEFKDDGTVTDERIKTIANKVSDKKPLSERETEISNVKSVATKISNLVSKVKKTDKAPVVPGKPTEFEQALGDNQKYVKGIDPNDEDFYLISSPENPDKYESFKRVSKVIPSDFEGDSSLYKDSRIAGQVVDNIGRRILAGETIKYTDAYTGSEKGLKDKPYEELISKSAFNDAVKFMNSIRSQLTSRGWKLYTKGLVVFDRKNKVAGTLDIIAEDTNGDLYILDFKTMKVNKYDEYDKPPVKGKMSKKENHTNQTTAYDIIVNNQYDKDVKGRIILPFEHVYKSDGFITAIQRKPEKVLGYNREIEKLIKREGGTKKNIDKQPLSTDAINVINVTDIEEDIFSGKVTSTTRTDALHKYFYKGDGIYQTKKGNFVTVNYKGTVKIEGDKIVADEAAADAEIKPMSKNDFAVTQGYKNWSQLEKDYKDKAKARRALGILISGESVHLYDITPSSRVQGLGKIIYTSIGTGGIMLAKAKPEVYIDGDNILLAHLKEMEKDLGSDVIEAPDSPEKAGLVLYDYYKTLEKPQQKALKEELQSILQSTTESGKSVITSNWFAREIADEAYVVRSRKKIESALRTLDGGQSSDDYISERATAIMKAEQGSEFKKEGVIYEEIKGSLSEQIYNRTLKEQTAYEAFVKKMNEFEDIEELKEFYNEQMDDEDFVREFSTTTLTTIEEIFNNLLSANNKKVNPKKVKKGKFVKNKKSGNKFRIIKEFKNSIMLKLVGKNYPPLVVSRENLAKFYTSIGGGKKVRGREKVNEEEKKVANRGAKQTNEVNNGKRAAVNLDEATANFIKNLNKTC